MKIQISIKVIKYVIIGFGHFEANGIELAGNVSSGAKYNFPDLFKLADYVFSRTLSCE